MLAERDILKLMSRSYDSKVEAWPQDNVIRITGDYDSCVDIVKLLVYTLKNIKWSRLDLDVSFMVQKGSTYPDQRIMKQVEQNTNTLIRVSSKGVSIIYGNIDQTLTS